MATITGTNQAETLAGTIEDDVIYGLNGDDTITGEAGNDTIYGGNGADRLDGGDGADILWGGNGRDTLIGGVGDVLHGEGGDDSFILTSIRSRPGVEAFGGAGEDTFSSSQNFAIYLNLHGDAGRDNFTFGFLQASHLDGGDGADRFDVDFMSSGFVAGDNGNDIIRIGIGFGEIRGGNGDDEITINGAKSTAYIFGDAGDDRISVGGGHAVVEGGDGDDYISAGYDRILSSELNGGAGRDVLVSRGTHTLNGGDGRDVLESCGYGNTLTGGEGADRFVYDQLFSRDSIVADTITDFSIRAHDVLDLSGVLDSVGASSDPFGDGWLSFVQVDGSTEVLLDRDGGGDGFQTLVILQGVELTRQDIGNYIV